MNLKILGIDMAKKVFHLNGIDGRGKEVYRKRVYRGEFLSEMANLPGPNQSRIHVGCLLLSALSSSWLVGRVHTCHPTL